MWQRFIKHKKISVLLVLWKVWASIAIWFAPFWLIWHPRFTAQNSDVGKDWPLWLSTWANFDGLHYIHVAATGYDRFILPFFPLFPLAIKSVHTVTHLPWLLSGLVVSHVAFAV